MYHEEIEKFDSIASEWWNKDGKFKPLHNMNLVRLNYIKAQIYKHFSLPDDGLLPKKFEILDIGCGGGLISVPLSELGASVTGVDASDNTISVAQDYARKRNLNIDYKCLSLEAVTTLNKTYDLILCLELIEHLDKPEMLFEVVKKSSKAGSLVIVSTINRNIKSWLLAILGAEYLLRWVPKGTHEYSKFLKPSEISRMIDYNHFKIKDIKGMTLDLTTQEWLISNDISVNYIMSIGVF